MKTTFFDLGIPFPLYEAPVSPEDDSDFAGDGSCCLCGKNQASCFHLGGGSMLLIPCASCQTQNALRISDKRSVACRSCGNVIEFPAAVAKRKEPKTCYSCLRAGHVALTKDTEFGIVSAEQLYSGVSGGIPVLEQDQFEPVVLYGDEEWLGVRLPQEIISELLRTPKYGTWQGECWLFCCQYPMTFVGEWQHEDFDAKAEDGEGQRLFLSIFSDFAEDAWDALGHAFSVYVFECKKCGKIRGHYDFD